MNPRRRTLHLAQQRLHQGIAERDNARVATVRNQRSSAFQKTRVNSPPKLVSLLGRLELQVPENALEPLPVPT